jgi:uncharacterized protein (DUF169 family)
MRNLLTMPDYAQLSARMLKSLNLDQSPIAISFSDSVPAGVPGHDGQVAAGCRFWQDAATSMFATSVADHELCAIGVHTHNLQSSPGQQVDLMDALKVFGELGYVRPEDIPQIPVLKSQSKHILYSPLATTPLPPDVVLLFVHASQTLVLSEATQQIEAGTPPAMGRPACAVVPQVMNTGRAALSLGCCGARAYLDNFTETVAIFAIPGARLEAYVDRIEVLTKANSVLSQFHQLRRQAIDMGGRPTIQESLVAFGASQA